MNLVYALHPELTQFHAWEIPYLIGMILAIFMMLGAVVPGWEVDSQRVVDSKSWTRLPKKSISVMVWRILDNALATMAVIGVLLFIGVFHFSLYFYLALAMAMQNMGAPGGATAVMMVFAIFGWLSIPMAIASRIKVVRS